MGDGRGEGERFGEGTAFTFVAGVRVHDRIATRPRILKANNKATDQSMTLRTVRRRPKPISIREKVFGCVDSAEVLVDRKSVV